MLLGVIIRHVNERSDIDAWQTLKDQFFDGEPIHRNPAGDARMQIRFYRRQAPDHLLELLPQFVLRF